MTQIHTSYKVSKMLKEFMGESAPEPIDGIYIKVGVCSNGPSYPRYALRDLLSKPLREAMYKAREKHGLDGPLEYWLAENILEMYYEGGMEAAEKALVEMMLPDVAKGE